MAVSTADMARRRVELALLNHVLNARAARVEGADNALELSQRSHVPWARYVGTVGCPSVPWVSHGAWLTGH